MPREIHFSFPEHYSAVSCLSLIPVGICFVAGKEGRLRERGGVTGSGSGSGCDNKPGQLSQDALITHSN